MNQALQELGDDLKGAVGDALTDVHQAHGELMVTCRSDRLLDLMRLLRDDARYLFKVLVDICGVDYPDREKRFDVVYNLLSLRHNRRIRVKVECGERELVPSVVGIWSAAGWYERETWDLYGILFADNPDLRRLLTDYGFDGHPMRKDFPLTGFVEVRYDEEQKRVVYEPVKLTQAFRSFDFMSPWEGAQYVLPGDEKAEAAKGKS